MTVQQHHPLILRVIGLAFFGFGLLILGFPAMGELPVESGPGAFWKTLAVTMPLGLLFAAVGRRRHVGLRLGPPLPLLGNLQSLFDFQHGGEILVEAVAAA